MIVASLPSTTTTATQQPSRRWLAFLSRLVVARSSVDWVQAPEKLAYPPSARAQRLMRNARCGGW